MSKEKNMKAVVSTNDIMAAMTAVSKDEVRRLLCGVHIEVEGGITTVVATDSYRLVAIESDKGDKDGSVTLDLNGVKLKKNQVIAIEFDGEQATITTNDGSKLMPPVIEGNYPNWRQLMPTCDTVAESRTSVCIEPKYVADMGKAVRIWANDNKEHMPLEFAGTPIYVEKRKSASSFRGVIMPVRNDKTTLKQPVVSASTKEARKLKKELEAARNVNEGLVSEVESLKRQLAEAMQQKAEPEETETVDVVTTAEKTEADVEPKAEEVKTATAVTVETLQELVAGHNVVVTQKNERSCIWVMGDTKPLKEELKDAGLRWAPQKQAWWYKPQAA